MRIARGAHCACALRVVRIARGAHCASCASIAHPVFASCKKNCTRPPRPRRRATTLRHAGSFTKL
jgi:hypothetical protein